MATAQLHWRIIFQRFPALENNRYYSVRAANTPILVLDSALDETSGPQGDWLAKKLDSIPSDVDFVFLVLHHPPYTASSDNTPGGGHSVRHPEHLLAQELEERQGRSHARFVVFSGHVHNYEHQEHNGVTYFVTGGGGARPYPIERTPDDPLNGKSVNYHYLLVEVDGGNLKITMHRLDLTSGAVVWTHQIRSRFRLHLQRPQYKANSDGGATRCALIRTAQLLVNITGPLQSQLHSQGLLAASSFFVTDKKKASVHPSLRSPPPIAASTLTN
jgi:hypothetical protein